mgnify:FL=1|tara:strand:+ start:754 stop:1029 length:276 start_codon:yes stop_codon:yes gene_type:complete
MADVDININNRTYRISCKDGEEDRISILASEINKEVSVLVDKIGQLGEARMILLAALILLDKVDENENRIEKILGSTAEQLDKILLEMKNL